MKKEWTAICLLLLFTIALQAFGNKEASIASGSNPAPGRLYHSSSLSNPAPSSNEVALVQINETSEEQPAVTNRKVHKKYKPKFLRQTVNYRNFFKRCSDKLLNCWEDTFVEKKEVFPTTAYNLIRPGYYTFLFRLSPF